MVCDVDPAEWEHDVEEVRTNLDDGWEPPPLLAEWRDGRLLLQDGNHRFEALTRAGASRAWTLVYFPTLEARDQFAASYLQELRFSGRRH